MQPTGRTGGAPTIHGRPTGFPPARRSTLACWTSWANAPVLYLTGLWFGEAWDPDELRSWLAHFVAQPTYDGFGAFELPEEHGGVRLCRSLRVDALPNAALADQAAAMADLTVKTFAMLERNPPPQIRASMPN